MYVHSVDLIPSGDAIIGALKEVGGTSVSQYLQLGLAVEAMWEYTVYYEAYRHHLAALTAMLASDKKITIPLGKTSATNIPYRCS
jgi:hypothetical protein